MRDDDVSDGWERRAPYICGEKPVERALTIVGRHHCRWTLRVEMRKGRAEETSSECAPRRPSPHESAPPRPWPRASSTAAHPLVLFYPQAVHRRDRDRSGPQMLGAGKGKDIVGRKRLAPEIVEFIGERRERRPVESAENATSKRKDWSLL